MSLQYAGLIAAVLAAAAAAPAWAQNSFCPQNFNSTAPGTSQTCGFANVFGIDANGNRFDGSPVPPSQQGFVTSGAGGSVAVAGGGAGGVNGSAQGRSGFGGLHAVAASDLGAATGGFSRAFSEIDLGFGDWAVVPGTPDETFTLHTRAVLDGVFTPFNATGSGVVFLQDNGLQLINVSPFVDSMRPFAQLDYDFVVHGGDQLGFYMTIQVEANAVSVLYPAAADMSNTGVLFLDLTGADQKLITASGHNYSLSPLVATGVPEPAAWAMMLIGFGMVGALARAKPLARATS